MTGDIEIRDLVFTYPGAARPALVDRARQAAQGAPFHHFQPAVQVLDDGGAGIHPVAAVDIGEAVDLLDGRPVDVPADDIIIEAPKIKEHGDYATTVAMRLVKLIKGNPRALAQSVIDHLDFAQAGILSADIAGPGFINFTMDPLFLTTQISVILQADRDYG